MSIPGIAFCCKRQPARTVRTYASEAPISRVARCSGDSCVLRATTSAPVTPTTGSAIIATINALRPFARNASRRAIRSAARQAASFIRCPASV